MMRHLERPYYVALLTAARMHGAAHQAPQVFQVITDGRRIRDRDLGRVRIRFYESKHVGEDETEPVHSPDGYVTVSTKETTVVNLIAYPHAAGGYSNIATIIGELGELNGSALARVASRRNWATARRTGWFVERFQLFFLVPVMVLAPTALSLGQPVPRASPSPISPGSVSRCRSS